ncbi:MAG: cysteine peptidase family C39 domain-containing protein [Planctomycetota bacterium]
MYFVAALLSVIAFLAGRRAASVKAYAVLLPILVAKAALHHRPDWEYALFPWPWYVFVQSWLFFPLGLFCLGLAAGLLPKGRNRKAVTVLACAVFLMSLWTERWMVAEPDDSLKGRAGPDRHCAQTTGWSCGPAACVTMLSYLGVDATEGEMARLCRTAPHGGTSLFHIARGLRLKLPGRDVRIVKGDPDTLREKGLAIVSVYRVHVVAVRFDDDGAIVHDPAKHEPRRMSFADYRTAYGGFAVVAE